MAGRQRGRASRAIGSPTMCLVHQSAIASRLLRLRCGGATNAWQCLPEPQTLFVADVTIKKLAYGQRLTFRIAGYVGNHEFSGRPIPLATQRGIYRDRSRQDRFSDG